MYENICDYVLLDQSGGSGRALNPYRDLEYLNHFHAATKNISFGVAGGLYSGNVKDLFELISQMYPKTNLSAQRNVMDADGNLNISEVKKFFSICYKYYDKL